MVFWDIAKALNSMIFSSFMETSQSLEREDETFNLSQANVTTLSCLIHISLKPYIFKPYSPNP